jgi:hypothetical protein
MKEWQAEWKNSYLLFFLYTVYLDNSLVRKVVGTINPSTLSLAKLVVSKASFRSKEKSTTCNGVSCVKP